MSAPAPAGRKISGWRNIRIRRGAIRTRRKKAGIRGTEIRSRDTLFRKKAGGNTKKKEENHTEYSQKEVR